MEAFVSRKRRKMSPPAPIESYAQRPPDYVSKVEVEVEVEDESTDLKLATLASLYSDVDQATLLDLLITADGSVDTVCQTLAYPEHLTSPRKRSTAAIGHQTSLAAFRRLDQPPALTSSRPKPLTRKGQTLHLYTPEDIASHTPCSIIHNFLPAREAEELLGELLEEAHTFEKQTFKLFDNVVESPHSACFYVDSLEEQIRQKTEYIYNGTYLTDVRQILPHMRAVSLKIQPAVNAEIQERIKHHYPNGKKLKHQSPNEWIPNAAFVNCYNGGKNSVGYHTDQLTYLGPHAIIGSLSLGVAREFRVRKILPPADSSSSSSDEKNKDSPPNNNKENKKKPPPTTSRGDAQGQIAIHLPHNSLLVMHAEMQEGWKHSIHPAQAIDPHPVSGNKRINVTYRHYRQSFHPRYTPRCKCDVPTVLRCVQRKRENRGRYMWMCYAGNAPGKEGCTFFQWAEFDDDGEPPWITKDRPP